jgi:protein TonB
MPQNPQQNHGLLWRALIISLILHALLMLQTVTLPSIFPDASRKLLSARLLPRATLPAASVAISDVPKPLPLLPARRQVRSAIPGAVQQAPTNEASVKEPATVAPPAVTTAPAAPAVTTAIPVVAEAADADFAESKKTYLFAIKAEARRVKKYPPRALAAGWGGTVYIRIIVNAGGNVQPPVLDKSSGYNDIDNAALTMMRAALAKASLPQELRNRNFELTLPIIFNLNEQ